MEIKPATMHAANAYDSFADDKKEELPPVDIEPFGDEQGTEVKYRVMKWWQCGMLMIADNISLGILSLPSAVATLGVVPAVLILLGFSVISWYTGFIIGQFKLRYPQTHSMGDAGAIIMGRFGRELLGLGQLLSCVFSMASHLLTFSLLMNELTDHAICTIAFTVVGLVLSFLGALPRTMDKVFWISLTSFASIFIATLVTMIATGVQRPARAHIEIITDTTFDKAFLAVTDIIIAYVAHATFFGFISEMENPRDFPKSLVMLQVVDTSMYVVSAVVIYCSVGPGVSSPALSSAGPVMKKVAYGLAIPTVVFAGVIVGHVACKYIYVRLFRGSPHMHNNGLLSVGAWVGIALGLWTIAWIIAESIPVFNDILGFMSALFGSSFSYGFPAIFWLFMNKGNFFGSPRTAALTIINLAILAMACAICGLGLYVSGKSIHKNSKTSSWTCANNAA
ncbi:transmembrane amino acid transporter protein-domain-containing protein [Aspergillus alliaceus]|uniref:Transmembrane amino acid transporter protein-domain-containing protein n=1 Tax=Petromyces alliaceus TaxID=209559 RepID=A0A5N6G2R5_PETAA|nr:transmembrane amino acid transporter protein-domain-containing protein [Aspergillus alliaceus]KAB8236636.1 transmembrane amino acid transporter protein-domain-containing protein [Aspergillus alliaceus]KAE8395518.1 transmembrane amino acid transporter protein-domain-containing protein [Aspergillus alliaceus]